MKLSDVKKLTPLERFTYWITERESIRVKKDRGDPAPWTDDRVLQTVFFTNPYREYDKVTTWFRDTIREPLRNDPRVLMATIIFRWFNRPETGQTLMTTPNLLLNWNEEDAVRRLTMVSKAGGQVFTGAYMIKSKTGIPKIDGVCSCISNLWRDRTRLIRHFEQSRTLQESWTALLGYPYLGPFMTYEVITDLRHTYLLESATDVMTWCNPGPGCRRGLLRLMGETVLPKNKYGRQKRSGVSLPADWLARMTDLLEHCNRELSQKKGLPPFEMREIEHSLCEWDKYERARLGDGILKRTYNGTGV